MKKLILTVALALGVALPNAGIAFEINADVWVTKKRVSLFQHWGDKGHVRCTVDRGTHVKHTGHGEIGRWTYVMVNSGPHRGVTLFRFGQCRGWLKFDNRTVAKWKDYYRR